MTEIILIVSLVNKMVESEVHPKQFYETEWSVEALGMEPGPHNREEWISKDIEALLEKNLVAQYHQQMLRQ